MSGEIDLTRGFRCMVCGADRHFDGTSIVRRSTGLKLLSHIYVQFCVDRIGCVTYATTADAGIWRPRQDNQCFNPYEHGPHEWYGMPAALRLDCPGTGPGIAMPDTHHVEADCICVNGCPLCVTVTPTTEPTTETEP